MTRTLTRFFLHVVTMMSIVTAQAANLLQNTDFAQGTQGWSATSAQMGVAPAELDGQPALALDYPTTATLGYPSLYQRVPVRPGQILEGRARLRADRIETDSGVGFYATIEFTDAQGARIAYEQFQPIRPIHGSVGALLRAVVPEGATQAALCLIVNGHGAARFAAPSLTELGRVPTTPPDGPVTLEATGQVACPSLVGFGHEDDGWFYAPMNMQYGIKDEDIALREGRARWMEPDLVRMFFYWGDWLPEDGRIPDDPQAYRFDTPNMLSHERTLRLYQEIGAKINLVGVEWAYPQIYGDPARYARAVGDLLEHLIRARGFDCIRYWTLSNEPNGHMDQMGVDFAKYVKMHELVHEECVRRGLDIQIIGSDDAHSLDWFRDCARDPVYGPLTGVFSMHRYFRIPSQATAPWLIADYLDALKQAGRTQPMIVAEYGFQDERSTHLYNPLMESYPYAVWSAQLIVEGLNQGVAGFSTWCLHEVDYPPNARMNYGLWNFKDRGWTVRPIYHVAAMFSRLTHSGQPVTRVQSTAPAFANATLVGDTLFWVNPSAHGVQVQVRGAELREVCVMTEGNIHGDRETGQTIPAPQGGVFEAPAMSFGYAKTVAK
jgi:hypothetical protein